MHIAKQLPSKKREEFFFQKKTEFDDSLQTCYLRQVMHFAPWLIFQILIQLS